MDTQIQLEKIRIYCHSAVELLEEVTKAIDNRREVMLLCCDLLKAFDYVHHSILLEELQYYGVIGKPHILLKSYLENREQAVL